MQRTFVWVFIAACLAISGLSAQSNEETGKTGAKTANAAGKKEAEVVVSADASTADYDEEEGMDDDQQHYKKDMIEKARVVITRDAPSQVFDEPDCDNIATGQTQTPKGVFSHLIIVPGNGKEIYYFYLQPLGVAEKNPEKGVFWGGDKEDFIYSKNLLLAGLDSRDGLLKAGYKSVFGENALKEIMKAKRSEVSCETWVDHYGRFLLHDVGVIVQAGQEISEEQKAEIVKLIEDEKKSMLKILDYYERIQNGEKGKETLEQELMNAWEERERLQQEKICERGGKMFNVGQRRAITRHELGNGSGASSIVSGRNGDKISGSFFWANGKWTAAFQIEATAEFFVGQFIEFCDQRLGEAIACEIEKPLLSKRAIGAIEAHSIEEALDQFAQLIEGKVMKRGGGWRIVAKD